MQRWLIREVRSTHQMGYHKTALHSRRGVYDEHLDGYLTVLRLSFSAATSLPPSLPSLTFLHDFYLASNQLTERKKNPWDATVHPALLMRRDVDTNYLLDIPASIRARSAPKGYNARVRCAPVSDRRCVTATVNNAHEEGEPNVGERQRSEGTASTSLPFRLNCGRDLSQWNIRYPCGMRGIAMCCAWLAHGAHTTYRSR